MRKNLHIIIFLFSLALIHSEGFANDFAIRKQLKWKGLVTENYDEQGILQYLYFDGAGIDPQTSLPLFIENFDLDQTNVKIKARFSLIVTENFSVEENAFLESLDFQQNEPEIHTQILTERKKNFGNVQFVPIIKDDKTGKYLKIVQFDVVVETEEIPQTESGSGEDKFAENSVLKTGNWFKLKIDNTGLYKITYSDLQDYGIDPSSIDPKNIRIYGNGDGMQPENNGHFRYDDLQENAIYVAGEEDGIFNENDYILFYGRSPHIWQTVLDFIDRQVDYYDDYNYYFITTSLGQGKRIGVQASSGQDPTTTVTDFTHYDIFEEENLNLILSGKTWYAHEFGEVLERYYQFDIPGLNTGEEVVVKFDFANRTFVNDAMVIHYNNIATDTVVLTSVNPASTIYARIKKKTINFIPDNQTVQIKLEYLPAAAASRAWLDKIRINARRNLEMNQGQMLFRDLNSVSTGNISRFLISGVNENTMVWEVTNHLNAKAVDTQLSGSTLEFVVATDSLREFIAFDNTEFLTPIPVGPIENQNLHASSPVDMVIVTHPLFLDLAEELDSLHQAHDGLTSLVTTPEKLYNEFSSGSQDPTAIRDFMRMLYSRHEGSEPRFLMLFGDGSFDPKDRIHENTNLIPTFQTDESLVGASSYVVEDYFGLLDESEGSDAIGILDIGIGRLPVETYEQGRMMVDRIKRYLSNGEPHFGEWRNKICIIADDEDNNLHLKQADSLADGVGFLPDLYNKNKIYLDAFYQIRTPKGDRYPDVNERIKSQIEEGALIMNYVGHGGKSGWAAERILQSSDISTWDNFNKLPIFITATCEFSRFDEPEIQTGGELVLLNPDGGGIALFTTTRLAYSNSNFALNQRFYLHAFDTINGEMPYLGDLIRLSKPPGQYTTRNFVLLGDPALKMAYPKYNVKTTHINGQLNAESADTLNSLDKVTVKGMIADKDGLKVEGFNGFLHPVLYDKSTQYKTIGNDGGSYPVEFYCQDKVIWEGKVSVTNGAFEFSFMIPKDIAFDFGNGKLSYYAYSEQSDAAGYYNDFIIGGINENAEADNAGPEIDLFINDLSFVSGDQTHENPLLIAQLMDESGINISDNGIGHSITAILNDNFSNEINLDEYYKPVLDDYRKGEVGYQFYNLPDGKYTIQVKAWDSYNNSAVSSIDFVINRHANLDLSQVMNYPNPFNPYYEETIFSFHHTRPGDELDITLQIFDLTGRKVLHYENSVITNRTETPFLRWDGTDSNGQILRNGVYLYTLTIGDEDGNLSTQKQKLILLN
jgi:hypothetical protein